MVWFVRSDPCGLFSSGLTVVLLIYAEVVMLMYVLIPWYGFGFHTVIYTIIIMLALISHQRAQFTNPGAIPSTFKPLYPMDTQTTIDPKMRIKVCKKCLTVKPAGVHHCSLCSRCIIRMDHHCPWVNNCVALFNQKYFLLFLLYTGAASVYSGIMLISRFVLCTGSLRRSEGCRTSPTGVVLCVLNFIEAIIFGLFVIIMMFDQCSAIMENTPYIDALQKIKGEKKARWQAITDVFGERLTWRWFFPLAMPARVHQTFNQELQLCEDKQREAYELTLAAAQRDQIFQKANDDHGDLDNTEISDFDGSDSAGDIDKDDARLLD